VRIVRSALEQVDATLWVIPSICVVVAIGLSYAAEVVDRHLSAQASTWFLFGGGPEGARALFSAVATSMLSFTGLVFSITILVLQLASNQFSPRALRTFLKDRISKLAMGVFIGTFLYALLGLRLVRESGEEREVFVPALSAWLTLPLVLLSVGVFITYLHHIAQSIRAIVIIQRIGEDTRRALERLYPEGLGEEDRTDPQVRMPPGEPSVRVRCEGRPGILLSIDEERLLRVVERRRGCLALRARVGEFLPTHALLFDFWGDPDRLDADAIRRCVRVGTERTLTQDASFGFRQLVDIAGRALSPSTNDPTTATEVLDQLHDLLRRLVDRRFPNPERRIGDTFRLILPRLGWGDYVRLALDEIQSWGKESIQVRDRLRALLEDLLAAAPAFRAGPLRRQLDILEDRIPPGAPE